MKDPNHLPELLLPQLATLAPAGPPTGDDWIFELKYDGYRLLCRRDHDRVDLYTRNGHRWTDKFPAIAKEVLKLNAKQLWLDGEIVVMTEEGRSCFGSLQMAVAKKDQQCLAYYVFDVPHLDRDLRWEPLIARKQILRQLLENQTWNLHYVDFQRGYGEEFLEAACDMHLEGIVSKKADSPYRPGVRSRDWLKSKCRGYHAIRNVAWKWWEEK